MTWADFVKTAYKAARSWGMQPSEFWSLSPQEWWWEADDHIRQSRAMQRNGTGPTEADWEDGRRRHRERMMKNG